MIFHGARELRDNNLIFCRPLAGPADRHRLSLARCPNSNRTSEVTAMTTLQRTAIVAGAGSAQGLGAAPARRFARCRSSGHRFRTHGSEKVADVVRAIVDSGGKAEAFAADATIESDVVALFDFAQASGHVVDLGGVQRGQQRSATTSAPCRPNSLSGPGVWRPSADFWRDGSGPGGWRRQVKAPSFLRAPPRACAEKRLSPHSRPP